MKVLVNYIRHHKNVNVRMSQDKSLSNIDVSIYNALFLLWNESVFESDLSINRNDVMKISKVGSANTYTKSLKTLAEKGYIKYFPSYNPLIGSKVTIIRYDKGSDNGTDNGCGLASASSGGNGRDTLYKPINIKTYKPLNKVVDFLETLTDFDSTIFENLISNGTIKKCIERKKHALKKESHELNPDETEEEIPPENKVEVPFKSEAFTKLWAEWKDYKAKEHKFYYKSEQSEKASLTELMKLSNGIESTAITIINQSMASGWKGFFYKPKQTSNGRIEPSLSHYGPLK